jgi:hypothetical protein
VAGVITDFTPEVFKERHHFEPLDRMEPERLASSLCGLLARAEPVSVAGYLLLGEKRASPRDLLRMSPRPAFT